MLETIFDALKPFTRKAACLDNQINRAALPERVAVGALGNKRPYRDP